MTHNQKLKNSQRRVKETTKNWDHLRQYQQDKNILVRDQRLSEVNARKQIILQDTLDKNKRYLIRWELKKQEEADQQQRMIDLKKNREILKFWLTIRALNWTFTTLRDRFYIHKEEKVHEEVRNFSVWRIAYRFKLRMKKIKPNRSDRIRVAIGQALTLKAQTLNYLHKPTAKDILLKVVRNYAEVSEIKNKFLTVVRHLLNIKFKMKRFLRLKSERISELRSLWDKTRNKLINDHLKASREIKKELQKFALIGSDTRDMMLDKYYSKQFNEFALKFIRWRFSLYKSCSADEYEGIFKRFELLKEQEQALFIYNPIVFDALKLKKNDNIDYTLYDFSTMSIDIPGAPIRPRTPLVNKHGRVIKQKEVDLEDDPNWVAVIDKTMPDYSYIPSLSEFVMMYTRAIKVEQISRKRPQKESKIVKSIE